MILKYNKESALKLKILKAQSVVPKRSRRSKAIKQLDEQGKRIVEDPRPEKESGSINFFSSQNH